MKLSFNPAGLSSVGFSFNSKRWAVLVAIALLISSCSEPASTPAASDAPASSAAVISTEIAAGLPRLTGKATAEITVGDQVITVELDGDSAPVTAGNFVDLAQKGVYDGTTFHRVVKSPEPFVAQGGDPLSKDPSVPASQLGRGGYVDAETGAAREIPLEILTDGSDEIIYGTTLPDASIQAAPVLNHRRGAIAMARSGVNTASSQFYITLADLPFLDGSYAVFGYVTDGMDAVDAIQLGDVITSVEITSGADNLVLSEAVE